MLQLPLKWLRLRLPQGLFFGQTIPSMADTPRRLLQFRVGQVREDSKCRSFGLLGTRCTKVRKSGLRRHISTNLALLLRRRIVRQANRWCWGCWHRCDLGDSWFLGLNGCWLLGCVRPVSGCWLCPWVFRGAWNNISVRIILGCLTCLGLIGSLGRLHTCRCLDSHWRRRRIFSFLRIAFRLGGFFRANIKLHRRNRTRQNGRLAQGCCLHTRDRPRVRHFRTVDCRF